MATQAPTLHSSLSPLYFSPQERTLPKVVLVVGVTLVLLGLLLEAGSLIPHLTAYALPMQIDGIVAILSGVTLMIIGYRLKSNTIDLSVFFNNGKNLDKPYLHRFIDEENIELMKLTLKNGYDVNAKDRDGYTPLHQAVRCWFYTSERQLEAVKLLVDHGARINETNEYGDTPLHGARTLDCVKFLIGQGANVHIKDDRGATPLHKIMDNFPNPEIPRMAAFLLNNGASVNESDKEGNTPLHIVCNNIRLFKLNQSIKDTIFVLLEAGADVSLKNRGATPFKLLDDRFHCPEEFQALLNPQLTSEQRKQAIEAYKAHPNSEFDSDHESESS